MLVVKGHLLELLRSKLLQQTPPHQLTPPQVHYKLPVVLALVET